MTTGVDRESTDTARASPAWRLVVVVAATGAGWELARLLDLHGIAGTQGFLSGATALLALGLFGSTTQISLPEVRCNTRIVVLAVTVGVVVKAALITAVMYTAFHDPRYLVLLASRLLRSTLCLSPR